MMNSSIPYLRTFLIVALVGLSKAWDRGFCKACVDDGCTFCYVNQVESCFCGGLVDCSTLSGTSYETDVRIGCSPGIMITTWVLLTVFVATVIAVGSWYCCCRNKDTQTATSSEEDPDVPIASVVDVDKEDHQFSK